MQAGRLNSSQFAFHAHASGTLALQSEICHKIAVSGVFYMKALIDAENERND